MTILGYADYGVNGLGNTVIVKPQWAAANPDLMKGFVKCAVAGIKASIAEPRPRLRH